MINNELEQRSKRLKNLDVSQDIVFQAISWHAQDVNMSEIDNTIDDDTDPSRYIIKVFGVTDENATISVSIKDFTPFFYVKLGNHMNQMHVASIQKHILRKLDVSLHSHIKTCSIVEKKDFWGFSNFTKFKFLRICFTSLKAMKKVQYILQNFGKSSYLEGIGAYTFKLYESNIDPYIRFIHINNLEPSGWMIIKGSSYNNKTKLLPTISQLDIEVPWQKVEPCICDSTARFLVCSFDIECMSETGDFPVPVKDYKRLAMDIMDMYDTLVKDPQVLVIHRVDIVRMCILYAFNIDITTTTDENEIKKFTNMIHKVNPKKHTSKKVVNEAINLYINEIMIALDSKSKMLIKYEEAVSTINKLLSSNRGGLPDLHGDAIIQIGSTFHYYGEKEVCHKHILTLGACDVIHDAEVKCCTSETELLLEWRNMIQSYNPDVITGYNIFGFDMSYVFTRAKELGLTSYESGRSSIPPLDNDFLKIGRIKGKMSDFKEVILQSSALGDNILKYMDMEGRVLVDMMKVVQRDHKLDSYKLDNVAHTFLKKNKNDVSPNDIFKLQRGGAADHKVIAEYCLQDCALCNYLMVKLEILANNMGMSNVCIVPLSFIFMRGQGVKIFSLVLKQCKDEGFVIPVIKPNVTRNSDEETGVVEDGYEGAIVLEPKAGIYLESPITVLDYASLYPSSMISENLSHDCAVIHPQYDNLPGIEYLDISYDLYEGVGDKKHKVGEKTCRFAQLPNGEKGIIPRILMKLLKARKETRKQISWKTIKTIDGKELKGMILNDDTVNYHIQCIMGDDETPSSTTTLVPKNIVESVQDYYNEFQKAVLDGLQMAYKITANSLYGQVGARTSPIYMKDIAACTTATGRMMIMKAKNFIEENYKGSSIVYGDTDSLFIQFNTTDENGNKLIGEAARIKAWQIAKEASSIFKKTIKNPHDLEVDKIFHPLVLLSKKRYVGNKYEGDMSSYQQTSMGIVLKRRDNANIVKKIYGGVIDIILNKQNIDESITFLNNELDNLIKGNAPLDDLVITKSLKADYKDPTRIAHKVLVERMGERDAGNKPQVNDRIPYVYVQQPPPPPGVPKYKHKILQGERIENPEYIKENNLNPDYAFYITNQIMKPVVQIYAIIADELGLRSKNEYEQQLQTFLKDLDGNESKARAKLESLKEKDVKKLLFDPYLTKIELALLPPGQTAKPPVRGSRKQLTVVDADGICIPPEPLIKIKKAPSSKVNKTPVKILPPKIKHDLNVDPKCSKTPPIINK